AEEYSLEREDGSEIWLRQRGNKLPDGGAIRTRDATEIKASAKRLQSLSNFSNSVFENAPFSIIETDVTGVIRAMNGAAERLTGYKRADIVGNVNITILHEPSEMTRRSEEADTEQPVELSGFD